MRGVRQLTGTAAPEAAIADAHLDGTRITDWPSFHLQSQAVFGFPPFYGRTQDAWIDSLSDLYAPDGLSRFRLAASEHLTITLTDTEGLCTRAPDVLAGFVACVAAVNVRYREAGERPPLRLLLL